MNLKVMRGLNILYSEMVYYLFLKKRLYYNKLYHPHLNHTYAETNKEAEAEDDLNYIELEFQAIQAAMAMDIDQAEAIVRTDAGSKVSKMSSKEIKRDLFIMARNNPQLFLELANDENINIRNIGIKAVETGIITLSNDNRTFKWAKNDRKLGI